MAIKVVAHLGPRIIWVGAEALGTADDISFEVVEATPEELKKLREAQEIRLTKILGESGEKKQGGDGDTK